MKYCILNDVQSSLASPASGWGVSVGNSPKISFLFGMQIVFLKPEKKKKRGPQNNKKISTLNSLVLRPVYVLEGA